jgi:putative peptidoglycan lipid II flippase
LRLILVINVPAAAGLMVLAEPIIRLLFERGEFRATDTALMAPVLAVFAVGLPFLSFVNIALRAFYAQKDTRTPVRAAILSFVVNLGLSLVLMGPLGTLGLAIAGNVAVVAQAVHLQTRLARLRPGLAFAGLWADLARIVLVTALMSALVAGGWWLRAALLPAGRVVDAGALVGLIGVGIAVYGAGLWLLRIEGREELAALLRRARSKLG